MPKIHCRAWVAARICRSFTVKRPAPRRAAISKRRKTLHEAIRSLIYGGSVKSAHDCSEGGLAVCLAEACISQVVARDTPRLLGAEFDLSSVSETRLDGLLFGEAQNRIVITTSALNAGKVLAQAKILGVSALRIGTVGGDKLAVKTATGEWNWTLAELHDLWWNALARAMQG